MANVSYFRSGTQRAGGGSRGSLIAPARRRSRAPFFFGGLIAVLAVFIAAAAALVLSKPSLAPDPAAIAKINLPLGGAKIQSVIVMAGPSRQPVPTVVRNDRIYPAKLVPANERLNVQVVLRRPGWAAWLTGHRQRLNLTITTPAASMRSHYVTVRHGKRVHFHFKAPISAYAYGSSPTKTRRHVLRRPSRTISLPRTATAGSVFLAAAPRSWETGKAVPVSWFPAGSGAAAVANPAPGSSLAPHQPITLTFSKPVGRALDSHLPPVSPTTQGTWHKINGHTIQFRPEGYGYGLGAHVSLGLPDDVHLTGDKPSWSVPGGSTERLQQLLGILGYLPVRFKYDSGHGVGKTLKAQEAAAIHPPKGTFSMRYPNTPSWLVDEWKAGSFGEIDKGAVMAFEDQHGMTADGVPGPALWKALLTAVVHGDRNSFGYTAVDVSQGSPESETTWHNGKVVVSGPVNTGVAAAPTAPGTFAVFEHLRVTTMSGTNPDGSHYVDPGIPYVSYFNGGDALHGFVRGSYGTPQSDGCVEMPYSEAAQVYPFTPIGTIVHVT